VETDPEDPAENPDANFCPVVDGDNAGSAYQGIHFCQVVAAG